MKYRQNWNELLWFSLIALAILAFSSIPFWVGRSMETDELLFRGTYFDESDYAVHISMMQAGRMGDWAYQMRFTTEEHRPAFLRMFYIILGHISKWIHLDVEITFHIARWIFGFIALYSIFHLCKRVFTDQKHAWAAFLLSVLGAGAGWLQLMLGAPLEPISPIDFWLIDAYVFFSISLFPSFSFTLALMAGALDSYLDYLDTGKWQTVVWVILLATAGQITNPIAFAVIDMAFAGATFTFWWKNGRVELRHFFALSTIALAQIPLLIYNFIILRRDPIWSQFTLQNETLSPPPIFYVWGFALFWIFAIYGIIIALRERNPGMGAMAAWAISGFTLAYLPVLIQRRFILGITIPLGILAIYGLSHVIKQLSIRFRHIQKREGLLYFTYILLASISSIYLSLGLSLFMQSRPADKFYPRDLESALVWLDENARPNDSVLGDIKTSQLVAQRTRLKVFVGHEMETLSFKDKQLMMERYYEGAVSEDWLDQKPIQWIIYGPYERDISDTFVASANLKGVYENSSVIIYKVEH